MAAESSTTQHLDLDLVLEAESSKDAQTGLVELVKRLLLPGACETLGCADSSLSSFEVIRCSLSKDRKPLVGPEVWAKSL